MPELPDIEAYLCALRPRLLGRSLLRVRRASPFVLRTAMPAIAEAEGREIVELRRLGKRIAIGLAGQLWLVLHLMIAGRLHWRPPGAALQGRNALLALDLAEGSLVLTEAGAKRRASLHLLAGDAALATHDRGGLEPLEADPGAFTAALRRESHTLKRALTDQRILAGIGNAFSDEILHAARLCTEAAEAFPDKVTAFRPGMAVHGRYGQPYPICGTAIQRIRYAESEANYCPRCQTGGRVRADRGVSRLLGSDWPRTIDQLEASRARNCG